MINWQIAKLQFLEEIERYFKTKSYNKNGRKTKKRISWKYSRWFQNR